MSPLPAGALATGPASLQGPSGLSPGLQAPAGATLGGRRIGGQFLSMTRARGMTRYTSRLPEIIVGMQILSNAATKAQAEAIMALAKEKIHHGPYPTIAPSTGPVYRTGALEQSLYVADAGWLSGAEWLVATDLEYAPYVHFGSIHNYGAGGGRAKPFLTDAVWESKQEFIARELAAIQAACR